MSDENKRLLKAVEAMKEEYPDWRIGQLVCNVAHMAIVIRVRFHFITTLPSFGI